MTLDPLFLLFQFRDHNPFEIILLLDHLIKAQEILTLHYFFLMEDHLILEDHIQMPLMRKHLIDLSFDIRVLFNPSHLHVSDHLFVVHLLEMNLF